MALEAKKIACAKHGKCEYVGSACGTPSTLKWLEHRMGGKEIIENEIGKKCWEPTMKGFMLCQATWYLSYRLLDTI